MTAKISASADGLKVLIGNAAEDALEINQTAKTIKGINGYLTAGNGPAFSAYPSSSQTVTNAATTKVFFQTEEYDTASAYDATTGVFTAPVAGFYQFNAVIAINAANDASTVVYNASLFKNSVELKRGAWVVGSNTANFGVEISYIAKLNAGDAVDCRFVNGGLNALTTLNSSVVTYFQGCLVRAA